MTPTVIVPAVLPATLPPPAAAAESDRLAALMSLGVLDTPPEPVFEAITAAAAQMCGTPIALVSLLDADRQWFKSNVGLPGVTQTPRDVAFCDHAIRDDRLFEVGDATADPRFAANPLVVGEPGVRFYAGAPIVLPGGERIGTVCVIDRQPRALSEAQRETLSGLGRIVSACLAERRQLFDVSRSLADSESRYRAIVEDQAELISLARPDGVLTFVNAAYARHFGLQPEAMVGHNLIEFVDEHDRPGVLAHLAAVCGSREAKSGVNRMVSAEGQPRWVAWSNRPLLDAQGRSVAIQSVGRDVSEQKLAEEALEDSERRFRQLYEATPAILHSVNAQGLLLDVSDLWLQVLGYERAEVIGRHSADFLAPESRRRAIDVEMPQFFRSGRCDKVAYQFVRKDGGLVDMLLSATLERDAQGLPVRSLAVLEDVTERKRLSAELGRTHAHLDAIVENVPAMLGYWDRDGITRFANRAFQAAVGLAHESIVGVPLLDILARTDPAATAKVAPHLFKVLNGRRQEFDCALLTTSGLRQLRATLVPDRSDIDRVNGFYGLWYDVTGQKALELRLSDSELRYRSLFDNLNSGFALHEIVVNPSGVAIDYKFLAMNAAFSSMTGIDPAQAIGRRITELPGAAADAAGWIGEFGRVAITGQPIHFERRSEALDRWFEVVAYRPAPGQFAVISQDITQRKAVEGELAIGEQRLRLLVDAVRDHAMLLLDGEGRITTWNVGAQRLFGYAADDIIGQHCERFIGAEAAGLGATTLHLQEAAETGQWSGEEWRYRQDGSRFWAATTLTAMRGAHDVPQGYVKVVHDLTERRRQHQRLEDALKEKETLLKEVYHRVKNNLQVVQSLLSLQKRSMADGPARVALEQSVQRVRAMALVHEKLYQSGNLAAVSLAEYTSDLLKQIGEATGAAQRNIRLGSRIAPLQTGLDSAIPFGLLVAELVGNGLKHAFKGRVEGELRVTLEPHADGMELAVCDDGLGLAGDFDILAPRSMGLQLASSLARQLGGELRAATSGGATFSAVLTRL